MQKEDRIITNEELDLLICYLMNDIEKLKIELSDKKEELIKYIGVSGVE